MPNMAAQPVPEIHDDWIERISSLENFVAIIRRLSAIG